MNIIEELKNAVAMLRDFDAVIRQNYSRLPKATYTAQQSANAINCLDDAIAELERQKPASFPPATKDEEERGWMISYEFLEKVDAEVTASGYYSGIEAIQIALIIALKLCHPPTVSK